MKLGIPTGTFIKLILERSPLLKRVRFISYRSLWSPPPLAAFFVSYHTHVTVISSIKDIVDFNATCQRFYFLFEENQCPTCQGDNEVDCNSKITMLACPKEAPICAVYKSIYDEFSRHCVSQEEYNHIVSECEKYRDCSMVKYGK